MELPPTEFPFTLPRGFVDESGGVHRDGAMRLATAFDEIAPLKDYRVQANPGYLVIILFSRVITRLGTVPQVTPKTIEELLVADLAFLQDFYRRINETNADRIRVACPHCRQEFEVEGRRSGE